MENKDLELKLNELEDKVIDLGRSLWHWKIRKREEQIRRNY